MDAIEHLLFIMEARISSGASAKELSEACGELTTAWQASAAYGLCDRNDDAIGKLSNAWGQKFRNLIYRN